ncbi:MAG: toprim domain-containing protein, partial [Patescibacteria group bacterium]
NSPDTILFTKSEVLYGLDKAKEKIRRKNYAVLVEGQMDLVLSHQAGIDNTVASSGTAFTPAHLERLKRLSSRIILAFDGDNAGDKAAEKATQSALALGLEVKIAKLPEGKDPADMVSGNPSEWKEILRSAKPAVEHFLEKLLLSEKDKRKAGKLIVEKLLPLIALLESSMERSHFVSLISKMTGIKEDVVWDDLKRVKRPDFARTSPNPLLEQGEGERSSGEVGKNRKELIEERLTEVRLWLKELPEDTSEAKDFRKEENELMSHLSHELLKAELTELSVVLAIAETSKDNEKVDELSRNIQEVHKKMRDLEVRDRVL